MNDMLSTMLGNVDRVELGKIDGMLLGTKLGPVEGLVLNTIDAKTIRNLVGVCTF